MFVQYPGEMSEAWHKRIQASSRTWTTSAFSRNTRAGCIRGTWAISKSASTMVGSPPAPACAGNASCNRNYSRRGPSISHMFSCVPCMTYPAWTHAGTASAWGSGIPEHGQAIAVTSTLETVDASFAGSVGDGKRRIRADFFVAFEVRTSSLSQYVFWMCPHFSVMLVSLSPLRKVFLPCFDRYCRETRFSAYTCDVHWCRSRSRLVLYFRGGWSPTRPRRLFPDIEPRNPWQGPFSFETGLSALLIFSCFLSGCKEPYDVEKAFRLMVVRDFACGT